MEQYDEQLFYISKDGQNELLSEDQLIVDESSEPFNENVTEMETINESDVPNELGGSLLIKPDKLPEVQNNVSSRVEKVKACRKIRDPATWKSNIRKTKCQAGQEYLSVRNKSVPKKSIKNKKDCLNKCTNFCAKNVKDSDREDQLKAFYTLDPQQKQDFLLETTERKLTSRQTKKSPSRREFSFSYYMKVANDRVKVCKTFYLGTFDISQTPIYNAHKKKSETTGAVQL